MLEKGVIGRSQKELSPENHLSFVWEITGHFQGKCGFMYGGLLGVLLLCCFDLELAALSFHLTYSKQLHNGGKHLQKVWYGVEPMTIPYGWFSERMNQLFVGGIESLLTFVGPVGTAISCTFLEGIAISFWGTSDC